MQKRAHWPRFSFDFLLVAIMALLLATPFLEQTHNELLAVLMALVLFSSAYVTSYERWHLVISAALGIPWLVLAFMGVFEQSGPLKLVAMGLFVVFVSYTAAVLVSHITRSVSKTKNLLAGGISVYFLIAIAFAVIYAMIYVLAPGALHFPEEDPGKFTSFLYFSIATITTVGYGDVYPVSGPARMLAVFEAAIGFLYIGVFIARLIGQFKE